MKFLPRAIGWVIILILLFLFLSVPVPTPDGDKPLLVWFTHPIGVIILVAVLLGVLSKILNSFPSTQPTKKPEEIVEGTFEELTQVTYEPPLIWHFKLLSSNNELIEGYLRIVSSAISFTNLPPVGSKIRFNGQWDNKTFLLTKVSTID